MVYHPRREQTNTKKALGLNKKKVHKNPESRDNLPLNNKKCNTNEALRIVTTDQLISSHAGRVIPTDSLPKSFLCFRFLTSVLIKSRRRSRSELRSARDPIRILRQIPAAATELSMGSCIGRCRRTIFCMRRSGLGYIAFGQATRIANHHPRG